MFLTCLVISPPAGGSAFAPIYLVDDMHPLVRTDATYQPFAFTIMLPDDDDTKIPQVTVTIDSVDRSIIEAIRTVLGVPVVEFFVVLASSPNTIELGPFNFSLLSATYDALVVTGTLGYEEDFLNQQVPGDLYTPTNSPAIFA